MLPEYKVVELKGSNTYKGTIEILKEIGSLAVEIAAIPIKERLKYDSIITICSKTISSNTYKGTIEML